MDLRTDIPPLPIAELAPLRFESADPDEPFLLGCGHVRLAGYCRLALSALRPASVHDRADRGWCDTTSAAYTGVRAVITPCAVVRSARIDDVLVTERIALVAPGTTVAQWTVAAAAAIVVAGFEPRRLEAGQTATATGEAAAVAAGVSRTGAGERGVSVHSDSHPDVERAFRTAADALRRSVQAGLQLETGDGTAAAFAWAKARLWAARREMRPVIPFALAALVTGQLEDARALLAAARGSPALPLLAARYAAATADLQHVAMLPAHVLEEPPQQLAGVAAAVWLAGLAELERTASDLGNARSAADLRALGRRHRAALAHSPVSARTAAVLTALRAPLPATPAPQWTGRGDTVCEAWRTWAALEQARLRAGLSDWRRLLAEADTPVRGAWGRRFGAPDDDPEAAALFVLTLAHGLLGIEPDAARHRIRIAPRLMSDTASFRARGILCGDACVSVTVRVDGPTISLALTQDEGAIPLTALVEPVIDAPVRAVFVDARPAALDVRSYGEGFTVPVQLVLDAERTLRIERTSPR